MPEDDNLLPGAELNRPRIAMALLRYAALACALVGLAWTFASVWDLANRPADVPAAQPVAYLAVALMLTAALAAAVLLWGVAELLRRADAAATVIEARLAGPDSARSWEEPPRPQPRPQSPADTGRGGPDLSLEVAQLLREIRDIALLNDAQRALRVRYQIEQTVRQLESEVPALLREHNWMEARRRVVVARERFPDHAGWAALENQIEQTRATIESRDVETASRQVADLIALEAWDRVGHVVRELLERHPDSTRARDLAERAARERDRAESAERSRLMTQAQEATSAKEWNTALTLVTTVIRKFPRSIEADTLRQQLPTLTANAEIQTRQRLEAEYRELVRMQRFDEAIRVAHDVIASYPNSPQASALRDQLPKLEEKAGAGARPD